MDGPQLLNADNSLKLLLIGVFFVLALQSINIYFALAAVLRSRLNHEKLLRIQSALNDKVVIAGKVYVPVDNVRPLKEKLDH